jgi:hypothetical protein
MLSVPFTSIDADNETEVPLTVKLLNACVPPPLIAVVPSKMNVLVAGVKAPPLTKLPARLIVKVLHDKVPSTVNVPFTSKLPAKVAVIPDIIVRLLKVMVAVPYPSKFAVPAMQIVEVPAPTIPVIY